MAVAANTSVVCEEVREVRDLSHVTAEENVECVEDDVEGAARTHVNVDDK